MTNPSKKRGTQFESDVVAFLREIEASMVDNIHTKAMEHHRYAEMEDQVSDETHRMFDELVEEFERA